MPKNVITMEFSHVPLYLGRIPHHQVRVKEFDSINQNLFAPLGTPPIRCASIASSTRLPSPSRVKMGSTECAGRGMFDGEQGSQLPRSQ